MINLNQNFLLEKIIELKSSINMNSSNFCSVYVRQDNLENLLNLSLNTPSNVGLKKRCLNDISNNNFT